MRRTQRSIVGRPVRNANLAARSDNGVTFITRSPDVVDDEVVGRLMPTSVIDHTLRELHILQPDAD